MVTDRSTEPRLVKGGSAEGKARFQSQFMMPPEIDAKQVRQNEAEAAERLLRRVSRMSIHGESQARQVFDRIFPKPAS